MEDNRSKDELLKIIEQKDQRIQYLEHTLKSYGLFIPDPEVKLGSEEKIRIFMDYFRCRPDLYAERFYSRKKMSFGWNPVCRNNFTSVCGKKNGKFNCFQCRYSQFEPVSAQAVKNHFLGGNPGIGFYPLLTDGTCWWLAIDFDHDSWFENMLSVYREAVSLELYPVMERSQSGQGGHLWFFFASAVKASQARRLGDMLLKRAMNRNPALSFSSFDRMFPNQDYIPEGGAGNLIALPLRFDAYQNGNSAFIDTEQRVIRQPIEYLVSRPRITWEELQMVLNNDADEDYFFDHDENQMQLKLMTDIKYDREIYGEISSWLKIRKRGLSASTLNILKRCATMYNPKYFELQRLHKPIYFNGKISKMLSYYEEDDQYLYLPKGLVSALHRVMPEAQLHFEDHSCQGETIDVSFQGTLRDDQKEAAEQLLKYNMGILQAIPGFGKTIVAIYLISVLKVNTLILVNKKNLQQQWEERMETFLSCPPARLKRDRYINKYGASRKKLNGKIDIAMVMTLANEEEIEALVSGYGLVLVDECHHVACDSFLRVMKNIRAAHVYGFSATPRRDDGLFKVITMFCGPIRKRIDSSQSQNFEKILVPRYTNHRYLKDDITYPDMCAELAEDSVRNFMIIKDVLNEYRAGAQIIVLTERVKHVHILYDLLSRSTDAVFMLTGEMGNKERDAVIQTVKNSEKNSILIATSTLIGEGFDLPELNCLFLVMPISSESRIEQYTGRTNRTAEGKEQVKVYDYVDSQIPMAQSMYYKRLKLYRQKGYGIRNKKEDVEIIKILHDKTNFEEALLSDLRNAEKEIVVFTSNPRTTRIKKYFNTLQVAVQRGCAVHYILSLDKENKDIKTLLEGTGGMVISNEHQKHFIIIDRQIVWNCSFDLFGNVAAEDFATRDINYKSAEEVLNTIALEKSERIDGRLL